MPKLTLNYIRKAIKGDKRFDQNIDIIEDGDMVAVWTNDGWSWNPLDGNRHVEHFNINPHDDRCDTVEYFQCARMMIEAEIPEDEL